MSAYDEYMSIAKRHAQAGSLRDALEALRSAQEIDDNEKVRRRIKKIQEAIDAESEDETTDEERDSGEDSNDDSGFQVCHRMCENFNSLVDKVHALLTRFLGSSKWVKNRSKSI